MRAGPRPGWALDAPIFTLLPGYRADTGAKVTLAHLLSNTRGIPNGFNAAAKAEPDLVTRDIGTAESVRRFASGDLVFEPGSTFDYALTNWFIVVAIVEALLAHRYDTRESIVVLNNTGIPQKDIDLFADDLFGAAPRG